MAWDIVSNGLQHKPPGDGQACRLRLRAVACGCVLASAVQPFACQPVELAFTRLGGPGGLGHSDSVRDAALPTAEREAGVDAAVAACETFAQSCGPTAKCSLLQQVGGQGEYYTGCVPLRGTAALGEACERDKPGFDDCASAGFCAPVRLGSASEGPFECSPLCGPELECEEGRSCLELTDTARGICIETCRFFGEDCAPGLRCTPAPIAAGGYLGFCGVYGDGEDGASCTRDSECGQDFSCEQGSQRCRQLCDADHPCQADLRCVPLAFGFMDSPRLCVE
jgi:hypothetical protein